MDDAIRNAITQMSTLHFVAAAPFAERVVSMGAAREHVFVVGAPGLDTVKSVMAGLQDPRKVVETKTSRLTSPGPVFLVSFHPETRADHDDGEVMQSIIDVLLDIDDSTVIISAPNADWGRNAIADVTARARDRQPGRVRTVDSFGHRAYIAAMVAADVVVGNSSSGIIEVPFTGTPTVNVGDRQRRPPDGCVDLPVDGRASRHRARGHQSARLRNQRIPPGRRVRQWGSKSPDRRPTPGILRSVIVGDPTAGSFVDDARLELCIVPPEGTLRDALQSINDAGIGVCMVCTEGRRFAGLLTDGDVRRAILAGDDLEAPLARHLGSSPVCATPHRPPATTCSMRCRRGASTWCRSSRTRACSSARTPCRN